MKSNQPLGEPKEAKAGRHDLKRPSRSGLGRRKELNPFGIDLKGALEAPVEINHSGKSKPVRSQSALLLRLREKALPSCVGPSALVFGGFTLSLKRRAGRTRRRHHFREGP
jgi:hypothetical protein